MSKISRYIHQSLLLAFFLVSINFATCEPIFGGENVCNKTITIKKEILFQGTIRHELPYTTRCGLFECKKTKTIELPDTRLKTIFQDVVQASCCDGYTETSDRRCAPICLNSCKNGKCIRPNVCQCDPEPTATAPGFVGSTCSRFVCLAVDRWGSKCDQECNCPQNSYCSATTGKCLCRAGWRGADCSEECDSSMECGEVPFVPFLEGVNVDLSMGRSQPLSLERTADLEDTETVGGKTVASLITTHMGLNLFLIILTFSLALTLMWYKKRLNEITIRLYQMAGPTSSESGSSNYANDSVYSFETIRDRPRMPIPSERTSPDGDNFLSKNLNFDSAARIINDMGKNGNESAMHQCNRGRFIIDPKVESHLINSQELTKQNIYSDIESNFGTGSSVYDSASEAGQNKLKTNVKYPSEDHTYQVPKSLVNTSYTHSPGLAPNQGGQPIDSDYCSNAYENESIYEEIPSPARQNDKRDKK